MRPKIYAVSKRIQRFRDNYCNDEWGSMTKKEVLENHYEGYQIMKIDSRYIVIQHFIIIIQLSPTTHQLTKWGSIFWLTLVTFETLTFWNKTFISIVQLHVQHLEVRSETPSTTHFDKLHNNQQNLQKIKYMSVRETQRLNHITICWWQKLG